MKYKVLVKPKSKTETLSFKGDFLEARVKAEPLNGAANESLIDLISEKLDLKKSEIIICSGHTSKIKFLEIPLQKESIIKIIEKQVS
ncbi:MAG: DUF167 domain-containing protein [Cytophagales bacterium]